MSTHAGRGRSSHSGAFPCASGTGMPSFRQSGLGCGRGEPGAEAGRTGAVPRAPLEEWGQTHARTHARTHAHTGTQAQTLTHSPTHTPIHAHARAHRHTRARAHTRTHTHTHTHKHTHSHTHSHTCRRTESQAGRWAGRQAGRHTQQRQHARMHCTQAQTGTCARDRIDRPSDAHTPWGVRAHWTGLAE